MANDNDNDHTSGYEVSALKIVSLSTIGYSPKLLRYTKGAKSKELHVQILLPRFPFSSGFSQCGL